MPEGEMFGVDRPGVKNTLGLKFYYDAEVLRLRNATGNIKTDIEQELDLDRGNAFQVIDVGVGISSPASTFNVFLKLESDFDSRELSLEEIEQLEKELLRPIVEDTADVELVGITVSPT